MAMRNRYAAFGTKRGVGALAIFEVREVTVLFLGLELFKTENEKMAWNLAHKRTNESR